MQVLLRFWKNGLYSLSKRPKNGQMAQSFYSGKPFQKGQIWMIMPFKRPNGNYASYIKWMPFVLQTPKIMRVIAVTSL